MENLTEMLDVAKTVVAIVGFLAGVIGTRLSVANAKGKKKAQWLSKVSGACQKFVKVAEDIQDYKGSSKKQFVMTNVQQFCLDNNIPFDYDAVSDAIEDIVELTKTVNKRDKDTTTSPEYIE